MKAVPNPYPQWSGQKIVDFRYKTSLVLKREIHAVRQRPDLGRDAHYVVDRPYTVSFRLDEESARYCITVPKGMLTDFASVPGIAGIAGIGRVGPHLEAAIVHDYLYIAWQFLECRGKRCPRVDDRRFADELFLVAMKQARVGYCRRHIMYLAVRWFGRSAYKSCNPGAFID